MVQMIFARHYRKEGIMSRQVLACLALSAFLSAQSLQAQSPWRFELRGGPAFPTSDLDNASLGTGFGFEGSVGYRIQPHLRVYGGWDWHRFTADASFAGIDNDFEETGYAVGLLFEHPFGNSESVAFQLRAGGTYNHIEIENAAGDPVADSEHGLGWEGGAGLAVRFGEAWQVSPGVRFRSLSEDFAFAGATTAGDLRYVALEIGVARNF
jgi:hypothetical protein